MLPAAEVVGVVSDGHLPKDLLQGQERLLTIPAYSAMLDGCEEHLKVNLCCRLALLPSRPPCFHHGGQFLPHGRAHWLTTTPLLCGSCGLRRGTLTLLLCPPCSLRSSYLGSCRCTHR